MPKISNKYGHTMTQLEKCTPYHSKSIHFWKALSSRNSKWLYFCGVKSKIVMADQNWNFVKKGKSLQNVEFYHAIPHIKFKARFVFFKPRPIYIPVYIPVCIVCIVCWGSHPYFTEKLQGEKRRLIENKFLSNSTFWSAIIFPDLPLSQKLTSFLESLKRAYK